MKGSKPMLIAYAVKDPLDAEQTAFRTRIGGARPHEKGPGHSIRLDALRARWDAPAPR
jgi:hypothetical protein